MPVRQPPTPDPQLVIQVPPQAIPVRVLQGMEVPPAAEMEEQGAAAMAAGAGMAGVEEAAEMEVAVAGTRCSHLRRASPSHRPGSQKNRNCYQRRQASLVTVYLD